MTTDITADERAELERLRAATAPKPITLKVGQKGGVSAYGLGRFPVTLYAEQWERLLAEASTILAFIAANESRLDRKQ